LRHPEEERDILKKAAQYFAREPEYRFMLDHRSEFRLATMCLVLGVGLYPDLVMTQVDWDWVLGESETQE